VQVGGNHCFGWSSRPRSVIEKGCPSRNDCGLLDLALQCVSTEAHEAIQSLAEWPQFPKGWGRFGTGTPLVLSEKSMA
jgi:hypothetical protein